MPVVARFYVNEITRTAYDPSAVRVTLQAVSRGEENKEWASATPSGNVTMVIKASAAAEYFGTRLGKDIVVTFEAADPENHFPTAYTDVPSGTVPKPV